MTPIHIAKSWTFRSVIVQRMRQNANLVHLVVIQKHVFRVDVEDEVGEIADRLQVIDVLSNHVGQAVVQSHVVGTDVVEHPCPDGQRRGQVLAAGPLVDSE